MVEQANITDPTKQVTASVTQPSPADDIPIKGAYNKYDSPFMQLIGPLIATRYLWLGVEDVNPKNFLKKPDPALHEDGTPNPKFRPWKDPDTAGYLRRNFAALGMGATFLGVMGIYSRSTLHDIKSLYSESVGYELDKKKEDVTYSDIFLKSRNAALEVTRKAYLHRTAARMATAASFFVPWHVFRDFKHGKPKYDANANMGVGAIGIYLFGEAFMREPSFFDAEQKMVNTAIHHADKKMFDVVQPEHVQTILLLQRKHMNKEYKWPDAASPEGREEQALSTRVADLLNQTYNNTTKTEHANLTIGKLNYLIGFGLLDSAAEGKAFVELANKSTDMKDVKAAASAIAHGQTAGAVFQSLGIKVDHAPEQAALSQSVEQEVPSTKFRDAVSAKAPAVAAPSTPLDFAARTSGAASVGV